MAGKLLTVLLVQWVVSGVALTQERDELAWADRTAAVHDYWNREPNDPFTAFVSGVDQGRFRLDQTGGELDFLRSLLDGLGIPESTQTLVFSTTSLQLRFISPKNPRALYFNEDTYIGYIPGGRIEVISIDPALGAIFYIFDIPRGGGKPVLDRSRRCMNCHSGESTRRVPGIVIKSVIPGPTGGSLNSFKRGVHGHDVAFNERFGGYHVTGRHGIDEHLGNVTGRLFKGEIERFPNPPGEKYDWENYLVPTSDVLAHLLHEHQAGFVNRVVEGTYRARYYLEQGNGKLAAEHRSTLEGKADEIVRYLLFADEAEFPRDGIEGDPALIEGFSKTRRADSQDRALKDLALTDRLFQYRCSYMIYSNAFQGLPTPFKQFVYRKLGEALSPGAREYTYLPPAEKNAIRTILRETLSDLPAGW